MVTARRTCGGTNAHGEPCRSPIVGLDGFCPAHRPGGEAEMRRRALRGGIASQRGRGLDPHELPPLATHNDAMRWLDILGRAVSCHRLSDRSAQAAIKAVDVWLKAHGESVVAKDVDELRAALDGLRKRGKLKALP